MSCKIDHEQLQERWEEDPEWFINKRILYKVASLSSLSDSLCSGVVKEISCSKTYVRIENDNNEDYINWNKVNDILVIDLLLTSFCKKKGKPCPNRNWYFKTNYSYSTPYPMWITVTYPDFITDNVNYTWSLIDDNYWN